MSSKKKKNDKKEPVASEPAMNLLLRAASVKTDKNTIVNQQNGYDETKEPLSRDELETEEQKEEEEALVQQEAFNQLAAALAAQQAALMTPEQRNILMRHVCEKSGQIGLSYLSKPNKTRRAVWLTVIVFFVLITSYQINKQLQLWRANPISTVWSQVYPESMHFPTIALCNTNNARASYFLRTSFRVEQQYNRLRALNMTQLTKFEYVNEFTKKVTKTYRQYRDEAAHHIEDMLLSCTWPNGTKCGLGDFKMMRTDVGVCYAINHNPNTLINLTTAGASESMRLALNVEKYENLFRSDCESTGLESSGIYVHIFQPGKVWLVSSESVVVEAGTQATIELRTIQKVSILQRQIIPTGRHGCMRDRDSPNYAPAASSSRGACVVDQWIEDIKTHCDCLLYNAPPTTTDRTPQCSVHAMTTCGQKWFKISKRVLDQCPIPCAYEEYSPALSGAKLPVNIIQYKPAEPELGTKRIKRQIRDVPTDTPEKVETQDVMFMDLKNHTIESLLEMYTRPDLNQTSTKNPSDCLADRHVLKYGTPEYVNFAYNRFYGREAQSRALSAFSRPLKVLLQTYEIALKRVRNESWLPMEGRYRPLLERIQENVPCYSNLTLDTSSSLQQIITKIEQFSDPDYETPDLLIDRVIREMYANDSTKRDTAKHDMKTVQDLLRKLWSAFTAENWEAKFSFSPDKDESQVLLDLDVWAEQYMNESMTRYTWATKLLSDRVTVFWDYYYAKIFVQSVVDQLDDYHMKHLEQFNESELFNATLQFEANNTWTQLAILLTTDHADNQSLPAAQQGKLLSRLVAEARDCRAGDALTSAVDSISDHLMLISNKLQTAHEALQEEQKSFIDQHNDRNALEKNNIVTVAIYMKEVSFQVMEQEPTYTGWSLMCDIGGSLGLFMGASIIGLVELVWLLFLEPCMFDAEDDIHINLHPDTKHDGKAGKDGMDAKGHKEEQESDENEGKSESEQPYSRKSSGSGRIKMNNSDRGEDGDGDSDRPVTIRPNNIAIVESGAQDGPPPVPKFAKPLGKYLDKDPSPSKDQLSLSALEMEGEWMDTDRSSNTSTIV